MSMELYNALPWTRKLRRAVTCVCFGSVLVWILFGNYANSDRAVGEDAYNVRGPVMARSLLGISSEGLGLRAERDLPNISISDECSDVHNLPHNLSQCTFVKTVDSCKSDGGILDYLEFIYCLIPHKLIPLAMIILFLWLIFLFIFLGATAEEFFCPALKVMSQTLRLSQNVAGVTLLALGNGAPDIFSAFAAINQKDDKKSSLAVGALFGAGIFVTTIVVGAVSFGQPFTLTQRPFLRDIIFYTTAVYWTFYLLWSGHINIGNAAGFVALYVFYVIVVIAGRLFYQKLWKKKFVGKVLGSGDIPKIPELPKGEKLEESKTNEEDEKLEEEDNLSNTLETDNKPPEDGSGGRQYRIMSIGSSDLSGSDLGASTVINITQEDATPVSSVQLHTSETRQNMLGAVSVPMPIPNRLLPGRRGASAEPPIDNEPRKREPVKPQDFKAMYKGHRRTLSDALDITEEVGAAVGIPHVPQIWQEVHRPHSRSRSSGSRPWTPIVEEKETSGNEANTSQTEEEGETAPLLTAPVIIIPKKPHPFVKMLQAIWPFGAAFRQLGILGKIYEVLKSPCSILLSLTVPVIDQDEDINNWNKWLNVLHCVTAPVVISLITNYGLYLIGGVLPIWTLVLIVGTFLAIVVAFTSTNDKPPIYHNLFAWLGFAMSVLWIYSIANEIVNLLQAFGVVIRLSDGILGLTLLAWGNSIGDAVSNYTMAKQGFPRMAIGACFGGPLLNTLLGIGIASVVKTIRRGSGGGAFRFMLYFTQVEFLASLFLLASLASSMCIITFLGFRIRRPHGVILILFYIVFLVVAILAERKIFTISISGVLQKQM